MKKFSEWMEAHVSERGPAWLELQRRRLLTWTRDELIDWLRWNDRNGIFSDRDSELEGMNPITAEEAVAMIMKHVEETLQTPEEMLGRRD